MGSNPAGNATSEQNRAPFLRRPAELPVLRDDHAAAAVGSLRDSTHPIARGRAGPRLLVLVLTDKFADHLPLNRQSDTCAREGIELDVVYTLADWVGACAATLAPLAIQAVRRIDAIFAAGHDINDLPPEQRLAVRRHSIAPLLADLESWMRAARTKMSRHAEIAKAIDHMLRRRGTFTADRFANGRT